MCGLRRRNALQAVHVVRHHGVSIGPTHEGKRKFQDACALWAFGRSVVSVCSHVSLREYRKAPRMDRCLGLGLARRASAVSACVATTTRSKKIASSSAVLTSAPSSRMMTAVTGVEVATALRCLTTRST